jgi:hypothetical protein
MARQNWVKTGQLAKEISGIKKLSLFGASTGLPLPLRPMNFGGRKQKRRA